MRRKAMDGLADIDPNSDEGQKFTAVLDLFTSSANSPCAVANGGGGRQGTTIGRSPYATAVVRWWLNTIRGLSRAPQRSPHSGRFKKEVPTGALG
jgi:hypothetical protein